MNHSTNELRPTRHRNAAAPAKAFRGDKAAAFDVSYTQRRQCESSPWRPQIDVAVAWQFSTCPENQTCVLDGFTIRYGEAAYGGGIQGRVAFGPSCPARIQNNLIVNNTAESNGGVIYNCDAMINDNTIYGNRSRRSGRGLAECHGTIRNCIIGSNTAPDGSQPYSSSDTSFCCIEAWAGGGNDNITRAPQFVDDAPDTYEDNDYHLLSSSTCIDRRDNFALDYPGLDMDGHFRIMSGEGSVVIDIGAYERGSRSFRIIGISRDESDQITLTWHSQPDDTYTVWSCSYCLSIVYPDSEYWLNEGTVASGGTRTEWADPSGFGRGFYRIRMELQ